MKTRTDYFDSDQSRSNLTERVVSGGRVTLVGQAAQFGISLVAMGTLARLLDPSDFGVMAIVAVFTGFASTFVDAGLSTATIQRKEITQQQVSNLFWISTGLGVAIAVIVSAAAPLVGWLYGNTQLRYLLITSSVGYLLAGLTVQHRSLLTRGMKFGRLVSIDLAAAGIGALVAVAFAFAYRSVWALVFMQLTSAAIQLIGSWYACDWRPSRPSRGSDVRPMLVFGGHLLATRFVSFLKLQGDKFLLSLATSPSSLGLYERANRLFVTPLNLFLAPIGRIITPSLSRLQSNGPRLREGFLRVMEPLMLATTALNTLLLVNADAFVAVVLGDQWTGAVPLVRLLAVTGITQPMIASIGWVLTSTGRTRNYLRIVTIVSCLQFAAYACGVPWGAIGVAAAFALVQTLVVSPISFWMAGKLTAVRCRDYWRTLLKPVVLGAGLAAAMLAARAALAPSQPLIAIAASLSVGAAVTVAAMTLLQSHFRPEWQLIRYCVGLTNAPRL